MDSRRRSGGRTVRSPARRSARNPARRSARNPAGSARPRTARSPADRYEPRTARRPGTDSRNRGQPADRYGAPRPRYGYYSDLSRDFFEDDRRQQARRPQAGRPQRASGSRRKRKYLKLEKPWRFATFLIIACCLLIFGVNRLIGPSKEKENVPQANGVHTVPSSDETESSIPVPLTPGRVVRLEDIGSQMTGFLGGMILSHTDNYAHEPQQEESAPPVSVEREPVYTYCVVLDPAHGGDDKGIVVENAVESEILLAWAQALRDAMHEKSASIEVKLTRDDDSYMDLNSRIAMANSAKADLFLSLRCDLFMDDTTAAGVSGQYWDSEETTEKGQRSFKAAERLASAAAQALGTRNRGTVNSVEEVLYQTEMPAVQLKLGFLSNDNDRTLLTDETARTKCANDLAEEIIKILSEYPSRRDEAGESAADGASESTGGSAADGVSENTGESAADGASVNTGGAEY